MMYHYLCEVSKRFTAFPVFLLTLCLLTGCAFSAAASPAPDANTATGIVKDKTGEPLIGVSVLVVGTTNGAATNIDGEFAIKNVKEGATLRFSYVGCKTADLKWEGTPLDVTLEDISNALDEVVVVGYGTQKKVNVTGAVSMVGSEAFESRPVANVQQALQGAIPGLNLSTTNAGGELNSTMSMNIRGAGTIGDGSVASPLVLIDGIEGSLNSVNPNDIESVSVLKDAAASSIYGSRAAFGVILVTTKNGQKGAVKVNYSGDVRFSTATQIPNMLNSLEFANYWNAAEYNTSGGYKFSEETIENIKKYMNGEFTDPSQPEYYGTTAGSNGRWNNYTASFANTDWFKEHYKSNVPSTQHNISLSGGTDRINWMVSGSYLLQNGLIRHGHDEQSRYTTNGKIGAQLADWARVDYNFKWTRTDYTRPYYLNAHFYHNIARRWPTCPVIDPNGRYMNEMELYELEDMGKYNTAEDLVTQQLRFTFTPVEGWNIVADGAIRNTVKKTDYSMTPVSYYDCNDEPFIRDSDYGTTSYVYDGYSRQNYYAINVFTDYTRSFGLHNAKVLVGMNYELYKNDSLYGYGENLTNSDKIFVNQAQDGFETSDTYNHRSTAGYFARLNYDYDGRYLFEANIRYDGSSRFLADRRWKWFPSFSAGWNIARESFFNEKVSEISTLKLRASWGQLGNTSSNYSSFWDWYPFYQQQAFSPKNSAWLVNGAQLNTASLPSIINGLMTWETIETWDVGFDVAALNNRLTGSFDWFSRTTKDMIGPAMIMGSVLGADAPKTNNCDMRTTGWELEIGWRDRVGKVNYEARFNISDNTSKILKYPYEGEFGAQSIYSYYNGKKLNEQWGYTTQGIAQSQEQMDAWLQNNKPNWGSKWGAGDIMYRDLNGDNAVTSGGSTLDDHGDLTVIGNTTPRFRFGLNLGAQWNGFDASFFFQGVAKRDWFFGAGDPYFYGVGQGMWQCAGFKEHLDYWTEDNTDAYYAKPYFGNTMNQQVQTRYKQSAAYLRCKNFQFGYSLPASIIRHAGMTNCRFYVSCDNMFTITSMSSIFDPEALGGDWGSGKLYPLQRTWSVGVNLSF